MKPGLSVRIRPRANYACTLQVIEDNMLIPPSMYGKVGKLDKPISFGYWYVMVGSERVFVSEKHLEVVV